MSLTVQILGTGTSIPVPHRLPPAHLVRAGELSLLLDCGSGCTSSLARAGVGLEALSGVLLTHLHPDHTADLVPLLFALANPLHPRRRADLPLWGPRGTAAHLEALGQVYGRWIEPLEAAVRVGELEDRGTVPTGPLVVTAFEVEHSGASLAYRIEAGGAALCLSGDTGPCAGLEAAAAGADLLVCECAALEGEEGRGHMTATDVGQVASRAGCRRVVLTHLYPHVERSDPVARVQRAYSGPVELGADGLVVAL